MYVLNIFRGRAANAALARTASTALLDAALSREFARTGSLSSCEPGWAWQDGGAAFKVYASGRRNCSGALATLELRERQDMWALIWYLLSSKDDTLRIEVGRSRNCKGVILALE